MHLFLFRCLHLTLTLCYHTREFDIRYTIYDIRYTIEFDRIRSYDRTLGHIQVVSLHYGEPLSGFSVHHLVIFLCSGVLISD